MVSISAVTQTESDIIQFSGQVVTEDDDEIIPVPYVNIAVKGTNRGVFSDITGFFSLVARKGETVIFSAIGYKTVEFVIPDTLQQDRYSLIQIMTQDTILLPETVVYPVPSRENFKVEFLALDVNDELYERAMENLNPETLEMLRREFPRDGGETAQVYFNQQAQSLYSIGQFKPQNIFNPNAWRKFIEAWKEGKFKRQN